MDMDTFLDGGFEQFAAPRSEARNGQKSRKEKKQLAARPSEARGDKQNGKAKTAARSQPGTNTRTADAAAAGSSDDDGDEALGHAVTSHKAQLEALKTADPEFYKYLLESDKALLDFSDDEEPASASESDDANDHPESDRMAADGAQDANEASTTERLDTALVEKWCRGAKQDATLGAVRNVVRAFRAACHYGDQQQEGADGNLRIMSDAAFQRVLVFTLTEADAFFRRLLSAPTLGALQDSAFTGGRWRKVQPLLKSYLGNALHLLAHLAEETTSTFILRRLRASLPFLVQFPALQAKYLKLVLTFFGASSSRKVRLQALLWLRELAMYGGRKALDTVLKGAYRTFASHAAFVTKASLPDIAFMGSGIVELYGLQPAASYEHIFGFVAQLAVLLRNALTIKSVDAYRQVYSWKAINCLELWARVLSAHATSAELQPLVYPVTQLLSGAARLVPSPRWFPVRLRLARVLVALSSATGAYVPVAPLLLEMLSWPDFAKSARGTGACPDLLLQLKLSKGNLQQPAVQQELLEQAMEVLASSLALCARSPAFPELAHLPTLALKRFVKACPVDRFRSQAKLLVDALDTNARFVGARRDAVDFAPKDTAAVSEFLRDEDDKQIPLLAYAARLVARGRERQQASAATSLDLPANGRQHTHDDEDSADLDASEQVNAAALLPRPKPAQPAARPQGPPAASAPAADMGDDGEDIVEDFVLSDDDDDDGSGEAMEEDSEPARNRGAAAMARRGSDEHAGRARPQPSGQPKRDRAKRAHTQNRGAPGRKKRK